MRNNRLTDDLRNLIDRIIGLLQKNLCIVDAQRYDKLHRCHAGVFLEVSDKPTHTHAPCLGVIFYTDILIVILIEIGNSTVHLPIQIFVFQNMLACEFPLKYNKQMAKQQGKHFLVVFLTTL